MTHRFDEIKAKTKSMDSLVTMSNIEGAILVLEQSGNINLAYRAAQDLDNMEYEIKTQAAELLYESKHINALANSEGGSVWGMVKDDLDERIDEALDGFTPNAD